MQKTMPSTPDVTDGCTIDQILGTEGFTFDTNDMTDLLEEEEIPDSDRKKMSNLDMMSILYPNMSPQDMEAEFEVLDFEDLKEKMTCIFGDGLVMKQVKKAGVGDPLPQEPQVTVQYSGYFEHQNEPYDTSFYRRDKMDVFRLGRGEIIPGLDIAIQSMRLNETSLFIIHPDLAFGKLGCPPRIPPEAEVLFKVTLVNFLDNGSADKYDELSEQEKKQFSMIVKRVRDLMNTAKDSFQRQKLKVATKEYARALDWLERASLENDEEEAEMKKLSERALSNLTLCYSKINKPKMVCITFQKMESPGAKAYFQYGKALKLLGNYDKSMEALQKAYTMEPKSAEIFKEIEKVASYHKKYKETMKGFAKMAIGNSAEEKLTDFQRDATEMVNMFLESDDLLKQELPAGMTKQEEDYFRTIIASHKLNFVTNQRFGKTSIYMVKPELN